MMLKAVPSSTLNMRLVFCHTEAEQVALRGAGFRSVRIVRKVEDIFKFVPSAGEYELDREFESYTEFILALPSGQEQLRDDLAVRLGDLRCKWIPWPKGAESAVEIDDDGILKNLVETARPMWTDEVCLIDDIPESAPETTYRTGFQLLDEHGFRLVRPAFMPVVGPYGSGKSVFLRQLAVNLSEIHEWRTLITSFEEKVKPRMLRDLRRHIIGHNDAPWTGEELANADAQIRERFRFLRRKRNTLLDMERFLNRVEYAVKVYGVDVVILDPVNELDHIVPKGENKTDYMGRFIMRCKQMADDYNLLFIAALHPPKEGVEKRSQSGRMMTLNDGADTAHWGNKADIGLCVWRPTTQANSPTLLNIDKLKDHETMGKPVLAKLVLDECMNAFSVEKLGMDEIMKEVGRLLAGQEDVSQ